MTWRAVTSLALGLPLGTACSLALNLADPQPCAADAECVYTAGQGSCVDGFCQPPGSGNDTDGNTTTPPDTAGDVTDTAPDSTGDTTVGEPTTTGAPACALNSECLDDQRCSDAGQCVNLLSPECDIIQWPDDERDNVEFIGSIMPTSFIFEELVQPLENAHQLAVEDFNDYAELQAGQKIAWVGCDSTGGADVAEAAAIHLRDNVGAHAIVGPLFSEAARQVAEEVTVDADMFVISPTASAPSLSEFRDNNLFWRVTPNDVFQANAIIDRMLVDLDPTPERLLILHKDDAYGSELTGLIQTDLFNGLPNVHVIPYPGPETFANEDDLIAGYQDIIAQAMIVDGIALSGAQWMQPSDHFTDVLIIGTSEAEALVGIYLQAFSNGGFLGLAPFPMITLSHGAVPTMADIVAELHAVSPPSAGVIFPALRGTSPNIFDQENFEAFNIRYRLRFNEEDALTSSSLSYDAAMAAMFAMVTIPAEERITGSGIAAGMASLNDPAGGTPISFGEPIATFVPAARNALAAGNTVDLRGVSGELDWNPDNGEIRADVLGWSLAGTTEMPLLNPNC
nr:ABC transporter substrate-binding protein [Deltaproteobacteria bacterium]